MDEVWGAIMRGLGAALGAIYDVIPSYGVAIIVLTVAVRVLLIPLTIKQIRSMTAMQRLQPQLKELQKKYKVDRVKMDAQTIRERRAKMQEESMRLYREHGVNPLTGCFPMLMQAPVFIALYTVLRAAIPVTAAPADAATLQAPPKDAICRPNVSASAAGQVPTAIVCEVEGGEALRYPVSPDAWRWRDRNGEIRETAPTWATRCAPGTTGEGSDAQLRFSCASPIGTGHLPRGTDLFADIVEDRARFLGMELACSPTQAGSEVGRRQCTTARDGGGVALVGYYLLVGAMIGTTFYQQKQVQQRAGAQQNPQMKMMTRIMPVFLGFISLSIPAGVVIYWVASNIWTIVQQTIFFRGAQPAAANGAPAPAEKPERRGLKGLRALLTGKEAEGPAAGDARGRDARDGRGGRNGRNGRGGGQARGPGGGQRHRKQGGRQGKRRRRR